MYDRADGVRVTEDADGHPINHYGVHKQANEGAARVYWQDDGLASVGLRPHIVYGPGRDHGIEMSMQQRRSTSDGLQESRRLP